MRIAIKIDNETMMEALRGVLNTSGDEYGRDLPPFERPGWALVETVEDRGGLPTMEEYEDGAADNFDSADYCSIKPSADKYFERKDFLAGLEAISESLKFDLNTSHIGDYPVVADGSGRVAVGCMSFTKAEADAIVAHYHKWKDRLPKAGDDSDSGRCGQFNFLLGRSHDRRLVMDISGEEIQAKYLTLIDAFRKKPLAKKK